MSILDPTTPAVSLYVQECLPCFYEAWGPHEDFWPASMEYLQDRCIDAYARGVAPREAAAIIIEATELGMEDE